MDEQRDNSLKLNVDGAFKLDVDIANLSAEMCAIPAEIAHANEAYSFALSQTMRAKAERDRERARASLRVRAQLVSENKKATEGAIEDVVALDSRVCEAVERYATCEYEEGRARGMCEALRAKRDMLMMLGARARDEGRADPRTLGNAE